MSKNKLIVHRVQLKPTSARRASVVASQVAKLAVLPIELLEGRKIRAVAVLVIDSYTKSAQLTALRLRKYVRKSKGVEDLVNAALETLKGTEIQMLELICSKDIADFLIFDLNFVKVGNVKNSNSDKPRCRVYKAINE